MNRPPSMSTRYLLTCAVLGVAGGVLTVGMNWASLAFATVGILFIGVTIGAWVLPSIVALALLQRPGAGFLVALLAGLVNVPLTPFGVAQLPTVLVSGLLVELPFALTLYRRWNAWIFYVGLGVLITAGSTAWFIAVDGVMASTALIIGLYTATALASVGFIGLGRWVAGRLRRAGVGVSGRPPRAAEDTATPDAPPQAVVS